MELTREALLIVVRWAVYGVPIGFLLMLFYLGTPRSSWRKLLRILWPAPREPASEDLVHAARYLVQKLAREEVSEHLYEQAQRDMAREAYFSESRRDTAERLVRAERQLNTARRMREVATSQLREALGLSADIMPVEVEGWAGPR